MVKFAIALGSAALFFIGLGGVNDDVRTWGNWVRDIPPDVGWGALMVVGLALLIVNLLPSEARQRLKGLVPKQIRARIVPPPDTATPFPVRPADNTVIFYQSRAELSDVVEYVSRYEVVWALWHTATLADVRDIWESKRIKKLVLIDPSSPYLGMQSAWSGRSVEEQQ